MDSLTHFHSRNVFYIHYSNSLKVTALYMIPKKKNGFTTPPPLSHSSLAKEFVIAVVVPFVLNEDEPDYPEETTILAIKAGTLDTPRSPKSML